MMKPRSRISLLALCSWPADHLGMTVAHWQVLLPDLTTSGIRSLARLLCRNELAYHVRQGDSQAYRSTEEGIKALNSLFPVLDSSPVVSEGWTVVLTKTAPISDAHFRYASSLLLSQGATRLSRGVYVLEGQLPAAVQFELSNLYSSQHLAIASVTSWQQGWGQHLHTHISHENNLWDVLSEISRETDELLANISVNKNAINQSKNRISSLYDRFSTVLHSQKSVYSHKKPLISLVFQLREKLALLLSQCAT